MATRWPCTNRKVLLPREGTLQIQWSSEEQHLPEKGYAGRPSRKRERPISCASPSSAEARPRRTSAGSSGSPSKGYSSLASSPRSRVRPQGPSRALWLCSKAPVHWPLLGVRLFLPDGWVGDEARRRRAHVPPQVQKQSKPEIALGLIDYATAWGVPFWLVTADAGYGHFLWASPGWLRKPLRHRARVSTGGRRSATWLRFIGLKR